MGKNTVYFLASMCIMAVFLVPGCAATKKIAKDIFRDENHLKKKIAFFPGTNQSRRGGQELGPLISASLKNHMSLHCQDLVIIDSTDTRDRLEDIPFLVMGNRDNMALAQAGRILGLNAVLESTLIDIWFTSEKRGIWGFRDDVPLMKVTLEVKAYDIETTATLVNDVFLEEVALNEETYREGDELSQYSLALIKTVLKQIVSKIADQVCEGLLDAPWKGFIVGRDGDAFVISAGRDVGLKEGDEVEVRSMADPMEGLGGEYFLLPGEKMGELRVTKVFPDKAFAALVFSDGDVEKSCSIRLKTR